MGSTYACRGPLGKVVDLRADADLLPAAAVQGCDPLLALPPTPTPSAPRSTPASGLAGPAGRPKTASRGAEPGAAAARGSAVGGVEEGQEPSGISTPCRIAAELLAEHAEAVQDFLDAELDSLRRRRRRIVEDDLVFACMQEFDVWEEIPSPEVLMYLSKGVAAVLRRMLGSGDPGAAHSVPHAARQP